MREYVLVAEDDADQAELIRVYLAREGFDVEVVHDGRTALERARRRRPDLVLLDVMMPQLDGLEVCRQLGGDEDIAVVLVTARSTENDILRGLYSGADDYLTKPFSPRELVARVHTVLRRARRTPPAAEPDQVRELVVGDIVIRLPEHEVLVGGRAVNLTPVEFELLVSLARRRDLVVSRVQLLESLHGDPRYVTERTIDSHIMNLRRKIESNPRQPVRLTTVYGLGYKLISTASAGTSRAT